MKGKSALLGVQIEMQTYAWVVRTIPINERRTLFQFELGADDAVCCDRSRDIVAG